MRKHLGSLFGQTIETISGRPNRVISVDATDVIVGTERSPLGKPVPLADVHAAADRLAGGEEVRINPGSVGYRFAFVGAALKSLNDVEVLHHPQRIRLRRS